MIYARLIFLFGFITSLLLGCERDAYTSIRGETMGTTYQISYKQQGRIPGNLKEQIDRRLQELNQNLSTYIADSDLMKFNQQTSTNCINVSQDFLQVMEEAKLIYTISNGVFNPAIDPLINLWGFDREPNGSLVPDAEEIKQALIATDFNQISIDRRQQCLQKGQPNLFINLSAIAKGYAVDELAKIIESYGGQHYLVEIGGEVKTRGVNHRDTPWNIAIEAPTPGQRTVQKIVNPGIMGMATSGDYRNYFEQDGKRYSHTIDPRTGYPIDHSLASVTVIADSAMRADALATAMLVMGPEQSLEFANKNGIAIFMIVKENGKFIEAFSDNFSQYLKSNK